MKIPSQPLFVNITNEKLATSLDEKSQKSQVSQKFTSPKGCQTL